jgi:hypothetical protein
MGNPYLDKQRAMQNACFDAGLQCGRQQIVDMLSLVLRDPEIMGTNIYGKDRLIKVVKAIDAYIDKYELAWKKHNETDHVQKQLDANLAEAYGEALHDTFHERYPYAPEFDYKKGKWK